MYQVYTQHLHTDSKWQHIDPYTSGMYGCKTVWLYLLWVWRVCTIQLSICSEAV